MSAARNGRPADQDLIVQGLAVDAAQLNFGEVWENDRFEWPLTIRNTTSEDVAIERFVSSCDCVTPEPATLVVPAGGTATIRLTINLLLEPSREPKDKRGVDVEVRFVPRIRGVDRSPYERTWYVRGHVRRVLNVDPSMIDFGTSHQGHPVASKSVSVTALVPIKDLKATCPPDAATVNVTRSKGAANRFEVNITPHNTLPPGTCRFELTLEPVGSGAVPLSPRTVLVKGLVTAEYQSVPETWHLGLKQVGESATQTITLYSVSKKPFQVLGIEAGSADTVVEPSAQDVAGKTFSVTQRISEPGEQTRKVRFSIQTEDKKAHSIPLTITYLGVPGSETK